MQAQPAFLSDRRCQCGARHREQVSPITRAPHLLSGVCVRVSACEGVWECLGGLWGCVCDRVGVGGGVAGQRLWPQLLVLSPQYLGVYMDDRASTPASHPLLASSPPALRAYRSPEVGLLSTPMFRCPFLSDHKFFPVTHTVFLHLRALTSRAPLVFLSDIPLSHRAFVAPAWQNYRLA